MNRSFSSWKEQPDLVNTLYNALSNELKNSYRQAIEQKDNGASSSVIGKELPTFELANDDGELVNLEEL
nr:hypothetical protein [uncultured Sphingobacterium sp.]